MATIVNTRIDERLVHGQVASYWTNYLACSRIMVIDDGAASNEIQKAALKMACPAGCKLSVLSIEKAVNNLNNPEKYVGEKLFCVFKGTATLKKAIESGFPYKNITVGNISNKLGSVRLYSSVSVTEDDVKNFKEMAEKDGVEFYQQMVPSDDRNEFLPKLEGLKF